DIYELTKLAVKNALFFDEPLRPQNSRIIFRRDCGTKLHCRIPDIKQEVKHTPQVCNLKRRQLL
ncbi:4714_t:CDS:1, partial [Ambispora gerdemannii]